MFLPSAYGVVMATSVAVGYVYARSKMRGLGLPEKIFDNAFTAAVLCGFAGARLYHVLSEFSLYLHDLLRVVYVWQGGLSIFGALLGGLAGLWLYQKNSPALREFMSKHKYSFADLVGLVSPILPFCQALGRLGNYFNQELYGLPTTLPWGIYIAPDNRLSAYRGQSYFHPWFLYEAILDLLVGMLLLLLRRRVRSPKMLLSAYLASYGVVRFLLEPFRADSLVYAGLHVNMLASATLVIAGFLLARKREN